MTKFIHSICHVAGHHCRTCRDLAGGRAWRAQKGELVELPPGGVDFACPFGRPWGWTGTPDALRIPPEAEAECRACMDPACPNVGCTTCGGETTVVIICPCYRNKWQLLPDVASTTGETKE